MANETISDQSSIDTLADGDFLLVDDLSDSSITKKVSGLQIATHTLDKLALNIVDITNATALGVTQAAVGDGSTHPASDYYGSLAALQADYPAATALTQEIDQLAIEKAMNDGLKFRLPYIASGSYLCNYEATISSKTFSMIGELGVVVSGSGSDQPDTMFTLSSCTSDMRNFTIDGDNKFRSCLYFTGTPNHTEYYMTVIKAGLDATSVTNFSCCYWFTGTDITIRSYFQKCEDVQANGDDGEAFGSPQGSARYVLIAPASGAHVDAKFYFPDWKAKNSDARELDIFNQNVNAVTGLTEIYYVDGEYNTNTRRFGKRHSGHVRWIGGAVLKATDFTAASPVGGDPQSEVGVKTVELMGDAGSGSFAGKTQILGAWLDYRGYPSGVIDSGNSTQSSLDVETSTLVGPEIAYSRANPETGSNQQGNPIGFRDSTGGLGSGIKNCKFINGVIPAQLAGNYGYLENCIMDDPLEYGFYVNATNKKGLRVRNNTIITRTTGRLYTSTNFRVCPIQGANTEVEVEGNQLIQAGNTDHRNVFIEVMTSTLSGSVKNNKAPATCTPNGGASSICTTAKNNSTSSMRFGDNNEPNLASYGNEVLYLQATSGNAFSAGDIGYLISAGTVTLADASAESTGKGLLLMATDTISSGGKGIFLVRGFLTTSGLTGGDNLYLSETTGDYTSTAPATASSIVRGIGYAVSSTVLRFSPDNSYIIN